MSEVVRLPLERIQVVQDTLHRLTAHVRDGLALAHGPDGYCARAEDSAVYPAGGGLRELDARIWLDIFTVLDQQGMDDHKARLALMLDASYDLTM